MSAARKKPLKGQVSLIGEVIDFELVNQPHIERSDQGEAVIVIRIPAKFVGDPMYESRAMQAVAYLARDVKSYKLDYAAIRRKKGKDSATQ